MSLGGITDYLRANNISIPENSFGTYLPYANQGPYEDIMARMRASGGRGGSGGAAGGGGTTGGAGTGGAMGGYDPNLYKRVAAASQAAGSGVIPEFSSIGPGSRGLSQEQRDERNDPDAWANLSDAQQAKYYLNNPGMGRFLSKGVNLIGGTTLGAIQKEMMPDLYKNTLLKMAGIDPGTGLFAGQTLEGLIGGEGVENMLPTPYSALAEINAQRDAENLAFGKLLDARQEKMDRESGYTEKKAEKERLAGLDSYYTGSTDSGGFAPVTAPVVAAPAIATPVVATPVAVSPDFGFSEMNSVGGGGGGGGGRYSGDNSGDNRGWGSRDAGGLAKGGQVSTKHLQGPNPAGPDQGYGALKAGEFVINDKAVKKYGIELMNAINSGKISKGKLRGLLEM